MFVLVLYIFRFSEILEIWYYFILVTGSLPSGEFSASTLLGFEHIDLIFQSLMLIVIPICLMVFKKKFLFLNKKINVTVSFITLITFAFIFSSLITFENPEQTNNIGMTRLLPPGSSVEYITLKVSDNEKTDVLGLNKKLSFLNEFNSYVFFDSMIVSDKIVVFQNSKTKEFSKNEIETVGGKPVSGSKLFLLGTDEYGRDILVRLIYGTRISFLIGIFAVLISLILGLVFGFIAANAGGITDTIISRTADLFLAFPIIYFVVLILALFGNSVISVILVLGLSGWMSLYKIVRAEILGIKTKDYFITANMLGLSKSKLLLKEILPVIMVPVTVNIVFLFGNVILSESALSYLGLSISAEYPSWGKMIESGQEYMHNAWWLIFFPGIALVLTLLAANSFGRKINSYFNPRIN